MSIFITNPKRVPLICRVQKELLSTCASHLAAYPSSVWSDYLHVLTAQLQSLHGHGQMASVFYAVIIPLLNPVLGHTA